MKQILKDNFGNLILVITKDEEIFCEQCENSIKNSCWAIIDPLISDSFVCHECHKKGYDPSKNIKVLKYQTFQIEMGICSINIEDKKFFETIKGV